MPIAAISVENELGATSALSRRRGESVNSAAIERRIEAMGGVILADIVRRACCVNAASKSYGGSSRYLNMKRRIVNDAERLCATPSMHYMLKRQGSIKRR